MTLRGKAASLISLLLLAGSAHAAGNAVRPQPARSLLDGLEIYSVDAPHSEISFIVPWMGISRVRGSFQTFLGTIVLDTLDLTRSSITVIIRTNSINTGFDRRDQDLKGQDFFDVEHFPIITFSSREIRKSADGYVLRGPLTIHGITREIEIPFTYNGHVKDAGGDDRVGFEGHLTVRRKDYGIVGPPRMNVLLDKGIIIGEDVDIPLAVEGWKPVAHDSLRNAVSDSLYRAILRLGVPEVAKRYREARAHTADSLLAVNEGTLNEVGYQLIAVHRLPDAIATFELETGAFPTTAFGYVGLGNAYAIAGDRSRAIAALEKAVSINAQAPRAIEILKRLKS